MQISPISNNVYAPKINKNVKIASKTSSYPTFKGAEYNGALRHSRSNINIVPYKRNPIISLQSQLLRDGFSTEDLKQWDLFVNLDLKPGVTVGLLADNFEELKGNITGRDIFKRSPKSYEDVEAIQQVYNVLKQKLVTDDVVKYVNQMNEFAKEFDKITGEKTKEHNSLNILILNILQHANAHNKIIIEKLLDDENFNNVCIPNATIGLRDKQSSVCGLYVLKRAQEMGYDKDFSDALSILITEAKPNNIKVIEKVLTEQKFLIENEDFVSNDLIRFVRGDDKLSNIYMSDEEIDLRMIKSLLEE